MKASSFDLSSDMSMTMTRLHVHLGSGQTDARRLVHGFSHVGDELAYGFIDLMHGGGPFMQPGVGKTKYG